MRFIGFIALMITAFLLIASSSFAEPVIIEGHNAVTDLPEVVALLLIGTGIGFIGTLIGAGGGFIVVPILLIFYGFSPQHAVGTSMTVVFLNALSGTFSYIAQKRIDYEMGLKFSVAAIPGVFIGAAISQSFSILSFSIIFGIFLCLISYCLFSGKEISVVRTHAHELPVKKYLEDALGYVHIYSPDIAIGLAVSFFVGVISGLFGIGGGIIHVPLMYAVLGVPVHVATATSHFILAITSFFGVVTFMGLKEVDLDYAVFIGIGSIFGAYLGARISLKTHPRIIKGAISFCLFMLAIKLITGVL